MIARELGLKPNAKKKLQKNLRNQDDPTTLALKAVGVTYAITGKGRGGKSELVKAACRARHVPRPRLPFGAQVRPFRSAVA